MFGCVATPTIALNGICRSIERGTRNLEAYKLHGFVEFSSVRNKNGVQCRHRVIFNKIKTQVLVQILRRLGTDVVRLSSPCAPVMKQVRGTRMAEPAIRPVRRFGALPTWPLAQIPSPLQSVAVGIVRVSLSQTCEHVSQFWTQGTLRQVVAQGLRNCSSAQVAPAASSQGCRNGLGTDSWKI